MFVSSGLHMNGHIHFDDIDMKNGPFRDAEDNLLVMYIYSCSKLANLLFTETLTERLEGSGKFTFII